MFDLPAAVVIGIICGLLGSFFIHVNVTMAYYRKRLVKTNTRKLLEAVFFAFLTASCFYLAVLARKNECYKNSSDSSSDEE